MKISTHQNKDLRDLYGGCVWVSYVEGGIVMAVAIKRLGRLGFGPTTFSQTHATGQYHLTHQVFGFVAPSEGTATEWTEIVVNSANPDALLPWVAFQGWHNLYLLSSTLCNLRCMCATTGRHGSVWLWHMHADISKCGMSDITVSLSVWFVVN